MSKKGRRKMNRQAENAKTGAAAMAHATYGRKTEYTNNRKHRLNEIREEEMQEEIDEMRINADEYADWDW